jgi:hypothetical protein
MATAALWIANHCVSLQHSIPLRRKIAIRKITVKAALWPLNATARGIARANNASRSATFAKV